MKKLCVILLSMLLLVSVLAVGIVAEGENPTITSIRILDADTQLIEINFSEPVNCKNLGYIIPVETYPNGNRAWANLEWNGQYMYYGCVDKDGKKIGEGEESYLCVDTDNDYIYATRMVVTVGAVQNYGIFEDLSGIEFKSLPDVGAFTTPDGRKVQPDASGSLYVKFSSEDDGHSTDTSAVTTETLTEPPVQTTATPETADAPETAEGTVTTEAPSTSGTPSDAETGGNALWILSIAAVVAVITVVAVIAAKKKR